MKREWQPLESAEVVCQKTGRLIAREVPLGWGFCMMLSSFGPSGFCAYISNQDREDTINLMREIANKIERGHPQS